MVVVVALRAHHRVHGAHRRVLLARARLARFGAHSCRRMEAAQAPRRRWIPPPAWTPGAGVTWREYLWQLQGWARLTGMPDEERGIAVALSLGGRAGRISRTFDHTQLGDAFGLSRLIQRLDAELGNELQDRQPSGTSCGAAGLVARQPRTT